MAEPLLEVRGLTAGYDGVAVLRELDLLVEAEDYRATRYDLLGLPLCC